MLLNELYGMDVIRGNSEDYEDKLGNRKLMKLDLVVAIDNICTQTLQNMHHLDNSLRRCIILYISAASVTLLLLTPLTKQVIFVISLLFILKIIIHQSTLLMPTIHGYDFTTDFWALNFFSHRES